MLTEGGIGGRTAGKRAAAVEAVSAGAEEEARAQGSRGASSKSMEGFCSRWCKAPGDAVVGGRRSPEWPGTGVWCQWPRRIATVRLD